MSYREVQEWVQSRTGAYVIVDRGLDFWVLMGIAFGYWNSFVDSSRDFFGDDPWIAELLWVENTRSHVMWLF